MKKVLRKITVILCITTILITPTSAIAATPTSSSHETTNLQTVPTPIIYMNQPDLKIFLYRPAYLLTTGNSMLLTDITNPSNFWNVPANETATFQCGIEGGGTVMLSVYKAGYGRVIYERINADELNGFLYTLPTDSVDCQYHVFIEAISNVYISLYAMYY